jgi:hypothetical protein
MHAVLLSRGRGATQMLGEFCLSASHHKLTETISGYISSRGIFRDIKLLWGKPNCAIDAALIRQNFIEKRSGNDVW